MDITTIDPTVWVAAITALGAAWGGARFRSNKKKDEAERVFHDIATDLVKDNVESLSKRNDNLIKRLDEMEEKKDEKGDDFEQLRREAFELRMRIVSFKTMLETIMFSAEQLVKMYDHLEPAAFKEALQRHCDAIQEAIEKVHE